MIDIKRLHELEKEVQSMHDKILKQSWLVHHIIGRDVRSNCGDVLILQSETWTMKKVHVTTETYRF